MADTKTSALTALPSVAGTEMIPVALGGANYRMTTAQFAGYVVAQVPAATLADDAVTNAKLRNSAALSVIGRSANTSGDPADIAAATDGAVLRRSGTSVGFGTLAAGAGSGLGTGAFVNLSVGTSAPGSPAVNELWVDTN